MMLSSLSLGMRSDPDRENQYAYSGFSNIYFFPSLTKVVLILSLDRLQLSWVYLSFIAGTSYLESK